MLLDGVVPSHQHRALRDPSAPCNALAQDWSLGRRAAGSLLAAKVGAGKESACALCLRDDMSAPTLRP